MPSSPQPLALGSYVLPGKVKDPRPAVGQALTAEHVGLATVWMSERYGTKDVGVIGGAIAQATTRIRFASATSHFLFRQPLALAGMAMTLQALSDGRFMLGVGRSLAPMWRSVGLPAMTTQTLSDSLAIHRRLCRGEKVSYHGPAGRFPSIRLGDLADVDPPPVLLGAVGPNTLDLAGREFDGAILHAFLTPAAVRAAVERVRKSAEAANRDPASVKIYATVVVAPEFTAEEQLAQVGGRAVSYYQVPDFGEVLARANGWDETRLRALRGHPALTDLKGAAEHKFTRDQLGEMSGLLPEEWLREGAVIGSAAACAARLHEYLAAGPDELLLHGAVPELLGPTLRHFARASRDRGTCVTTT
jgi:5,10-methylenetetrahydromethanopterin reductase